MFGVVEIDQRLVEEAASLAIDRALRSLDALHLAAALLLPHRGVGIRDVRSSPARSPRATQGFASSQRPWPELAGRLSR